MATDTKTPPTPTATQTASDTALTAPGGRRMTLRRLFEQQRPELSKLIPRGMDPERMYRMALTECVKQPKLLECTAESWALAMQRCAAQGLYPDSDLGYMYLVARKNRKANHMEVSAMRGYQGDIKLCRNTGELLDIYAEVVHAKDEFKVIKGLNRDILHVPYDGDDDPGALRATYAVAKLQGGETAWVVLFRRDVERHRASSESWSEDWSPWQKHTEEMWKKTAVRALAKWLPKANEALQAAEVAASRAIDVTPLGNAEVPLEPPRGLTAVTERLEDEQDGGPGPGCEHPKATADVLRAVPKGKTWPCPDCGEEIEGTQEPELPKAPATTATPVALQERAAAESCSHTAVPPSRLAEVPVGRTIFCPDCGASFPGEKKVAPAPVMPAAAPSRDREPGDDDGPPAPATVAEMVPRRRRNLQE